MFVNLEDIEKKLQIQFCDKALIKEAFTHPSFKHETKDCLKDNNRLEFFGDSVLNLVVTKFLYFSFPEKNEGVLSQMRASLISKKSCVKYLTKLGVESYLLLGKGEKKNFPKNKDSFLGNLFEAIIGAVFIDKGVEEAEKIILYCLPEKEYLSLEENGFKNKLQMITQKKFKSLPIYETKIKSKTKEKTLFSSMIIFQGNIVGEGLGFSKKEAEVMAAKQACLFFENENKTD